VVVDGSKNIATLGTVGCGAITSTGSSSFATSVKTPLIEYTDGDDAITIADGGGITAAAGITSTAASNTLGATSFNEADITNVGNIALDSISSDTGTNITVTLGTDAADDFIVGNNSALVVTGDNDRVGIGTDAPSQLLHVKSLTTSGAYINYDGQSNGEFGLRVESNSNGGNFEGDFTNDGGMLDLFANSDATSGGDILVCRTKSATSVFLVRGNGRVGIGVNAPTEVLDVSGNATISGSIAKGSGSFKISHPLESKAETHNLVHSFIEGPQADLIYRGKVDLVDGSATVNVDTASGMTEGTFVVLCRDVQSFTTNESGWTAVRSSVSGNILTIEAQDATCTDSISWMVVGERQDDHMIDTGWTDEIGKVIVEPLIEEEDDE
jgi:hypothetical protein